MFRKNQTKQKKKIIRKQVPVMCIAVFKLLKDSELTEPKHIYKDGTPKALHKTTFVDGTSVN